jgi:hypothetical protein
MDWYVIVGIILVIIVIIVRTRKRGYFWKAKDGTHLSLKDFFKRWKQGIEGITPLQQTKTTLWSYPLVLGGILTGIVIMIIRMQWWLLIILIGSFPLSLMGFISTIQKYFQQKKVYDMMKEIEPVDNKSFDVKEVKQK